MQSLTMHLTFPAHLIVLDLITLMYGIWYSTNHEVPYVLFYSPLFGTAPSSRIS